MNNPMNPNKLTAIIMIFLAFALIFIIGVTYQSYQNGLIASKILRITSENINSTKNTVDYLKNVTLNNNIIEQNQQIFKNISNQMNDLLNKTNILVANTKK